MNYLELLKSADEKSIPSWKGSGEKWHALFVQSGEEDKVKERLLYKFGTNGLKILVPKRKLRERKDGRWETRIHTLLPGYVLLNGHFGIDEYYMLKGIPGLITILKDQSGPLVIQETEIKVITRLICNNETIGSSSIYMEGGRIVVVDGPLLGMEGLIESVDQRKGRAKVRLNLAGEPRMVELAVSMVQPA